MPFLLRALPHVVLALLVLGIVLAMTAVVDAGPLLAAVLVVLGAAVFASGSTAIRLLRDRDAAQARHLQESEASRASVERLAQQNAELSTLLFRTVDRLQVLSSVDRDLAERTLDLDSLLSSLARRLSESVGDVAGVYLIEEHQPALRALEARTGPAEAWRAIFEGDPAWELPPLIRTAVKQVRTQRWAELREAAATYGTERERAVLEARPDLRDALAVPIHSRSGDTVGGLLLVRFGAEHEPFSQDDVELAEQVADRAATAIDNARLYRARETFLALAAHELRTPTTALRAQAQLMLRRLGSLPEERLRLGLENIERQTGRLARLINDLLDVTRIEAAKLELHQERVDGGLLATDLVERFEQVTSRQRFRRQGQEHVWVVADPVRLDQVLTNFLANAVKFCVEGEIIVATERRGAECIFSVVDHGPGIPLEKQTLLFERFSQLGEDGDRRGGLGLGLYLSRELVLRMGGRIWVESDGTPGHPTAFRIALPAAEAAALPAPEQRASPEA